MRRTPKTTPSTFAPSARRYASSGRSAISLAPVATPALRNAKSTGPTSSQAAASATSTPVARSSERTSHPSASSSATAAAPIPDAPPVTSALRNKDDLSHVAAVLDQGVRRIRLRERELRADDRPDRAPRPERDQLLRRLLD